MIAGAFVLPVKRVAQKSQELVSLHGLCSAWKVNALQLALT